MMNELLRLANELIELHTERGLWPFEHSKDTIYVIKGYQDLLRRMITNLEASDSYVENNRCLSDANDLLILEAIESLPGEEIDKNG